MAPGARYANYFEIGYNAFEFLIDFGHDAAEGKRPERHTRIVTNPESARTLLQLLQRSMEQYERRFGARRGRGTGQT